MTAFRSRREVLRGVAAIGMVSLAGCTGLQSLDAEDTVMEEYSTENVSRFAAVAVNGDVSVESESRDSISVTGTRRAANEDRLDDVRLASSHEGETLTLAVETEDSPLSRFRPTPRMDLQTAVPETIQSVDVETTNGDIEVREVRMLSSSTTNGNVTASGLRDGAVAETTNGDIDLEFRQVRDDVVAETTNGDVNVAVPSSADVTIVLETTNGDLTVEGLDDVTVVTETSPLEATNGAGTYTLDAETTNGDITVRGKS